MFYSQTGEDEYLYEKLFKNKRNGTYIELGALDGVLYSNTKFFEESLQWSGILIEPHPLKFEELQRNRPNNYLFNELVSNSTDPLTFRYFIDTHAAVSGIESSLSQHHFNTYFHSNDAWCKSLPQTTKEIIPRSLTDIIHSTSITHIDFMSLDVEGHEYEVLLSWDFSIPIDVILIETLGVQPDKDENCRKLLLEKGYHFLTSFKHNEIFVLNLDDTRMIV